MPSRPPPQIVFRCAEWKKNVGKYRHRRLVSLRLNVPSFAWPANPALRGCQGTGAVVLLPLCSFRLATADWFKTITHYYIVPNALLEAPSLTRFFPLGRPENVMFRKKQRGSKTSPRATKRKKKNALAMWRKKTRLGGLKLRRMRTRYVNLFNWCSRHLHGPSTRTTAHESLNCPF